MGNGGRSARPSPTGSARDARRARASSRHRRRPTRGRGRSRQSPAPTASRASHRGRVRRPTRWRNSTSPGCTSGPSPCSHRPSSTVRAGRTCRPRSARPAPRRASSDSPSGRIGGRCAAESAIGSRRSGRRNSPLNRSTRRWRSPSPASCRPRHSTSNWSRAPRRPRDSIRGSSPRGSPTFSGTRCRTRSSSGRPGPANSRPRKASNGRHGACSTIRRPGRPSSTFITSGSAPSRSC